MANFQEIIKKIIKYLVEGLVVALACFAIPKHPLDLEDIGLIALIAAMTFSILDVYIPSTGSKQGASFVGLPSGF